MQPTLKEACELIAEQKILVKKDGTHPTWKEVFEYSPRGELFMIWEWYQIAKDQAVEKRKTDEN